MPDNNQIPPDGQDAESTIDATLKPGQQPPGLEEPKDESYNPDKVRDRARASITYWLLAILSALVLFAFVFLCRIDERPTFEQFKALIELLLGPVVALVSAATGFYFGAQSASAKGK